MNFATLLTELKCSTRLALPMLASLLSQTGIWIINSIMMGHIGAQELAAGGLAITAYFLVQVLFFGFLNAAGICLGHAKGAKNTPAAIRYMQHGIYLALILSIPMGFLLWHLPLLLQALQQPPELVYLAGEFLHGMAWGSVGILGFMMFREICAHLEVPKVTMIISFAALPLSALLNYAFIYGKLGFPIWNMFGIGIANALVQYFMLISIVLYAITKKEVSRYLLQPFRRMNWQDTAHLIHIGLPTSLTYVLEAGLFNISAVMMGWVGTNALAAHQILLQYGETMFMGFFAISQTLTVRAARSIGANDQLGLNRTVCVNVIIGFLLACSVSLIYWYFPTPITAVFVPENLPQNAILFTLARQYFHIAALFVLFDALQIIGNNALRVLKDTYIPVILNLGSYWLIGIGSGYLFGIVLGYGGQGIWAGLTLGVGASAIATWWRWIILKNRRRLVGVL